MSVVTVFNRLEVTEQCLLASLRRQTGLSFEWIGVDNTAAAHDSAASALNAGARTARGEILLFAHQDVSLYGEAWLAELARWMRELSDVGVAGVVGPSAADGRMVGYMKDRKAVTGHPLTEPVEVQTLDECVLAVRREVFEQHPFDESIGGWHVYGVDACLSTRRAGLRTYVLPLFVHHDSASINLARLAEAHAHIHREHGARERLIYTTCGVVASPSTRVARKALRVMSMFMLPNTYDYLTALQHLAEVPGEVLVLDFFTGRPSSTWPSEVHAQALDGKALSDVPVTHCVLFPGDSSADALQALDHPPRRVVVFNLQNAAPEQLEPLRASLSPQTEGVWAVYPRWERDAVRARAAEVGWKPTLERALRPFAGPGPFYLAELADSQARCTR